MRPALAIAAAMLISAQQAVVQLPHLPPERWRADIRYAVAGILTLHKNAFHHTPRAEFDRKVAELLRKAGRASDAEMVVGLQQLLASLGDGHSYLSTWELFRFYPLDLMVLDGDVRVVRASSEYREALGARIVAIDAMAIAEVRRRVGTVVPQAENQWFEEHQEAGQLVRAEMLNALGVAAHLGEATFTFQRDGEEPFAMRLRSLPPNTRIDWIEAAPMSFAERHLNEPFSFTRLPGTDAIYVNFNGYDGLEAQARNLFQLIDQTSARALVIDLRWNGGGNFDLPRQFVIPEIKRRRTLMRRGSLYVLVGRRTFSAGMTNALDFKRELGAILVGEPIGARPNGFQENGSLRLPNSKLRISLSTRYYRFWPTNEEWIRPDVPLPPTWDSVRKGRDLALDHVQSRLATGR